MQPNTVQSKTSPKTAADQALEEIVGELRSTGLPNVDELIFSNFLVPVGYIRAADDFLRNQLPMAEEVAADYMAECVSRLHLIDVDHQAFSLLLRHLCSYRSKQLRGEDVQELPPDGVRRSIPGWYNNLTDPQKLLVDHYFGSTLDEIRAKTR